MHTSSRPSPLFVGVGILALLFASASFAIGDDGADGRFERRESLHFTLFQDVDLDEHSGLRGSRHFEQRVLQELEGAYDRLGRILELRPGRKLVVTVWDPALFDARFAGLFRFPAAGFYGGTIHVRGGEQVSEALVRVLHHELVHAALDAEAPSFVWPAWLNEGLAEWFEARAAGKREPTRVESALLARAAASGALPSLAELGLPAFGGLRPDAAAVAYLASYAFIDSLAVRGGDRGLVGLWSEVARARSVERGVRRAFGRNLAALESAFRRALGAD